jgi:predicted dehydrogenase
MNRREFLKSSAVAASSSMMFSIVPSTVLGAEAPSNRITVGMIGTGRQAISANLNSGFLKLNNCQVVAVNDVDSWRMQQAKDAINSAYSKNGKSYDGVKCYDDYRDLVKDKAMDAVMISTTDHWHAPATIAAALEGKHVCMEKAFSIAPMHARAVVEAVKAKGVVNRLDSEFRSNRHLNRAVEMVHNGVLGKLTEVVVGVPSELNGSAVGPQKTMDVPKELNYDMWLGPAFPAPYTMQRVHEPKTIKTRPGWLRIEDYCNGMITNWGAHLNDIALWGMKKEHELPVSVRGTGTFDTGLWNTINNFEVSYKYADGLALTYKTEAPYVIFKGEKGWLKALYPETLTASDESILKYEPGPGDVSYKDTLSDKADFLRGIETGKPTLEPLEVGYNVYLLSMMGLIAIKQGAELSWDHKIQRFVDNNAANAMLTRPFREKWLDKNVVDWMNKYQDIYL